MTRDEFIGKLQMCYFGDRNAFNEIVNEYDKLKSLYNKALSNLVKDDYKIIKAIEHIKNHQLIYQSQYEELSGFDNHLLDILGEGDNNE